MTANHAAHDPVACDEAACQRCDDYANGYQRGKAKARFEIEVWDDTHALTCGCEPCRIVRGIVAKAVPAKREPSDKPFIAR